MISNDSNTDWLHLVSEIGAGNAEIAALYKDNQISYEEMVNLIGNHAARKIKQIFGHS